MARAWIPTRREIPGLALAFGIGLIAFAVGRLLHDFSAYVSDLVVAIAIGALVLNSPLRRLLGVGEPGARDADPYERGLRFTGKWVLRASIVLLGLKLHLQLFHVGQLWIACAVLAVTLPTALLATQFVASRLGLRRELGDLLSIGTMVCGASAIGALAPVVDAHRRDQGLAITSVFLFSVVALLAFHPIGQALGLPREFAGMWSGLAVNDLSSAVAVGAQFSDETGVIATAAKSLRILLLGPILVIFSVLRRRGPMVEARAQGKLRIFDHLPLFVVGYLCFGALRITGDAMLGGAGTWQAFLGANDTIVKILILAVCGGIGLQIDVRTIVETGWRALAAGAAGSLAMAGVCLWMMYQFAQGSVVLAIGGGLFVLTGAAVLHMLGRLIVPERLRLEQRLASGSPLSMREAVDLLDFHDADRTLTPKLTEDILRQLFPAIGELQPLRDSAIVPPINYRRLIYWISRNGSGSLVAMSWPPGTTTHIHSHNYVGVGKTIEGRIGVVNFENQNGAGEASRLRMSGKYRLDAGQLIRVEGAATIHAILNQGESDAIDVYFYGPALGNVPERFVPAASCDVTNLPLGAVVDVGISPDKIPEQLVSW